MRRSRAATARSSSAPPQGSMTIDGKRWPLCKKPMARPLPSRRKYKEFRVASLKGQVVQAPVPEGGTQRVLSSLSCQKTLTWYKSSIKLCLGPVPLSPSALDVHGPNLLRVPAQYTLCRRIFASSHAETLVIVPLVQRLRIRQFIESKHLIRHPRLVALRDEVFDDDAHTDAASDCHKTHIFRVRQAKGNRADAGISCKARPLSFRLNDCDLGGEVCK